MFRGCQNLILKAAKSNGVDVSQSAISLWANGERGMNYENAVAFEGIFNGTTAHDWMVRDFEVIQRAVAKWAAKHCKECSRAKWEHYIFK